MGEDTQVRLSSRLLDRAGLLTVIAGIFAIIGLVLLFAFFAVGGPLGLANDVISIPALLLLLPAAWVLYRIGRETSAGWSLLALGGLVSGLILVNILQVALITEILPFQEQLPWVLAAGSLLGIWYALGTYLARGMLPHGLVRLGLVTGGLILAGAAFFWMGLALQGGSLDLMDPNAFGTLHPLIFLGFGLVIASYALSPAWALWIGFVFLRAAKEADSPDTGTQVWL